VLNFQSPDEQIMSVAFSQQWNENFYCGDYNNDGFVNLLDFALIDSITLMQNTQQLLTILAQNWLDYCF
jgi:patatin-like phospholipase/acyl hydrolase